ncbi:MAG: hypothetical protein H6852_09675 [Geminicoccaceae bacterium]|nr:hypothetical protein [Geminicoccaceae bacterium]HRY27311.1 hypothetical protein [Geminicoccaceae bacterium]
MRIFWTMALTLGTLVACSSEPETVTVYCYETLADSACYFEPDPGHGNRLLAVMEVKLTPEVRLRAGF